VSALSSRFAISRGSSTRRQRPRLHLEAKAAISSGITSAPVTTAGTATATRA